jgi:hypothetical protein
VFGPAISRAISSAAISPVPGRDLPYRDLLAADAQVQRIVEGQDGQGGLGLARVSRHADQHAQPDVIVRDDRDAERSEVRVAADVIRMHVSVDDEADWALAQSLDGFYYLGRKGRVLVVYEDLAFFGDEHGDVAARAADPVNVACQVARLDGHLGEARHAGVRCGHAVRVRRHNGDEDRLETARCESGSDRRFGLNRGRGRVGRSQ